jgi:hypothetical protein
MIYQLRLPFAQRAPFFYHLFFIPSPSDMDDNEDEPSPWKRLLSYLQLDSSRLTQPRQLTGSRPDLFGSYPLVAKPDYETELLEEVFGRDRRLHDLRGQSTQQNRIGTAIGDCGYPLGQSERTSEFLVARDDGRVDGCVRTLLAASNFLMLFTTGKELRRGYTDVVCFRSGHAKSTSKDGTSVKAQSSKNFHLHSDNPHTVLNALAQGVNNANHSVTTWVFCEKFVCKSTGRTAHDVHQQLTNKSTQPLMSVPGSVTSCHVQAHGLNDLGGAATFAMCNGMEHNLSKTGVKLHFNFPRTIEDANRLSPNQRLT